MNKFVIVLVGLFALIQNTVSQGCEANQYECTSGVCIRDTWVCDGKDDCDDGSDEPPHLTPEQCPPCDEGYFRCQNGKCIFNSLVCNGEDSCGDNSDEPQDPHQCPECGNYRFRCSTGRCIFDWLICDGKKDCDDGSDEPPHGNPDLCPACDPGKWRYAMEENGGCGVFRIPT